MEKYIKELLSENNRVIIPNFGAFIVSKEHGTSVLFNNFLSFNDGLLVNYIAEQKGIDTIIATEQVFEYADNLKKELEEVGTYIIDKLGTFRKDDNGILRFQQSDDVNELLGQDTHQTNEISPKTELKEKDEPAKKVFVLDIEDDDSPAVEPTVGSNETQTRNTIKDKAASPEKTTVTPPAGLDTDAKNTDKGKVQLKKTVPSPKPEKKKKNLVPILLLIATAIIILFFGIYYIFYNQPKQPEPVVAKKAILKPNITKEVAKDTTLVVANIKESVADIPQEMINPGAKKGRIYIIVGGFKDEVNAQKMLSKLKSEGYNNAETFLLNNMHLVSIDSDTSYKKMEARQQALLNQKIESWLYKVK
ncbi:Sporulation related domain-containing protein [Saccharicrinis carchari]|uniref:Sporulation related domain-containing protein n=1 Tax=Saccharicrinis carchari TaxID=1168039 RepID=A0A521D2V7_SACCC|nr:SPOR domain-containing protein [Saccharicrinis carchari]SMO66046.1 Sporulation related domain-containing protein [Saccharicrinis carchari]